MIINPYAFGVAYDPDAQAFFTASGLTGATNLTAINNLVVALKGYGIWTKMKAIYPIVGGTAALHKWNLKDPQDTNAAFRLVFNGGMTHSSTGILFGGVNGYANTFLSPSVNGANNGLNGVYSRSNLGASGSFVEIGVFDTGIQSYTYTQVRSNNLFAIAYNNSAGAATLTETDGRGFFLSQRLSQGGTMEGYKNGTRVINAASQGSLASATTFNTWIGAGNLNNGITSPTNKELAFACIGTLLTQTEHSNFYTAVQAYQTTLSRQV